MMSEKPESEITRDRRLNLLCIPWVAVIVLTFPGVFMFPQLFPVGLFRMFGMKVNDTIDHAWIIVGWLVYVVLTVAACLSRRKRVYFIIYTILCILLALNIAGCRTFYLDMKQVH
jgi:hypothetical protein